ncbi:MAG: hypothetical protein K0S18_218 [Anaerocolumna sp.]|jgi:2-keto-3-deoxy-galactonokinase|nr:hypothetical protein [Anaerocolumna sp.]
MKEKYIIYYDSGTSNTRVYLLDKEYKALYTAKLGVGSKDSAIAGSNMVLIEGMKKLYDEVLDKTGISEEQIKDIYASGMITSPYGLKEVPHLKLPMTIQNFADSLYCHYEDKLFHKNIYLVPGLKTVNDDITYVNNMRGEEIEIIGTLEELNKISESKNIALILPGSHTHVTYVQNDQIIGIISNFTGELFHALKTSTILSPILSADSKDLSPEMVKKGVENLKKFGFNRAIYICHAMRLFNEGSEQDRFSYAEGVVSGGVRESLEYYIEHYWKECDTVAIVSDEFMFRLFSIIFEDCNYIKNIKWLPISESRSYAIDGLKKIIEKKGDKRE